VVVLISMAFQLVPMRDVDWVDDGGMTGASVVVDVVVVVVVAGSSKSKLMVFSYAKSSSLLEESKILPRPRIR